MTPQLLNMIMKRSWTGKDGNINRPSLIHAMEGLSPFTIINLNEDEVALLNDEQDLLNPTYLVSVGDLRLQRLKLKIWIPLEAYDFMLMLKRYGNLLYTVFQIRAHSLRCLENNPYAPRVFKVSKKEYDAILERINPVYFSATIYTVALGEVNMLCELITIHEDLRAKKASILHTDLVSVGDLRLQRLKLRIWIPLEADDFN